MMYEVILMLIDYIVCYLVGVFTGIVLYWWVRNDWDEY